MLSGGLCGSALACRFGDGLGTRAIAVFLFAGCGPDFGKIRRPAPGVRFGPITSFRDQNQGETHVFIPVFLVGACTYLVLPVDLFVAQLVACAASFYAHVFFDKEYHIEGSRLQRFAWFRRKQELHFVHHRHANSNFAVIHFFWDRLLGTYRKPDAR